MSYSESEIIEQLSVLKMGYISILNELEVMTNWEKIQLEALYETKIGRYKIESLELQIELKGIKKKLQLCHQFINQGEAPNFDHIEVKALIMLANAQKEINDAKAKVSFGINVLNNLASVEDSIELRKIYKTIAKSLHPDVNPNITESQKELWFLFKNAYENGDLDKMKSIQIVYADELKKTNEYQIELSEKDTILQIETLKQGIVDLETRKKELNKQFPFDIAEQIRDEEWVQEKQNLIFEEIKKLKQTLILKQDEYELIRQSYE